MFKNPFLDRTTLVSESVNGSKNPETDFGLSRKLRVIILIINSSIYSACSPPINIVEPIRVAHCPNPGQRVMWKNNNSFCACTPPLVSKKGRCECPEGTTEKEIVYHENDNFPPTLKCEETFMDKLCRKKGGYHMGRETWEYSEGADKSTNNRCACPAGGYVNISGSQNCPPSR